MKKLTLYAFLLIVSVFSTVSLIAKNNTENNIPATVLNAFAAKYPKATIKTWRVANGEYIVKAKEDGRKYFAVFDNKGNWIETTTKTNWPWHIAPQIKKAFKKTQYGSWHIYGVSLVEKPSGQYVQLMVDDTNPTANNLQNLLTTNWLLVFKLTGEFVEERNINTPPLL